MEKSSPGENAERSTPFYLSNDSDELTARYARDGYLKHEFSFEPGLLDEAVEATRAIAATGKRRAQDLWRKSPAVKALAADARVLSFLSGLYGRRAFPFQTLNFVKGSEQKPHADAIHFSSEPPQFMCGVWIALEDVEEENGPLIYYPGSHRLPVFTLKDIGGGDYVTDYEPFVARELQEGGFEEQRAPMKKGEAFIWSANLFHGGAPIVDRNRTRLSLVTHYYFEGCAYTTPLRSTDEKPYIREVYDISRGVFVKQPKRPSPFVALAARYRNLMRLAPVS